MILAALFLIVASITVVYITAKCLVAIFNRKYREELKLNDDFWYPTVFFTIVFWLLIAFVAYGVVFLHFKLY